MWKVEEVKAVEGSTTTYVLQKFLEKQTIPSTTIPSSSFSTTRNIYIFPFQVFATLPFIVPPTSLTLLGFDASIAARLLLHHHPSELDPTIIKVAREYFNLSTLRGTRIAYIGDAVNAIIPNGFSGIVVDLFLKGSLIPELQAKGEVEEGRKDHSERGRELRGGETSRCCSLCYRFADIRARNLLPPHWSQQEDV
ncbi:hypothetical protein JHK82_050946 [Glycine max]|nr:hypothetical protein JHK82_050946 [Glycine max]